MHVCISTKGVPKNSRQCVLHKQIMKLATRVKGSFSIWKNYTVFDGCFWLPTLITSGINQNQSSWGQLWLIFLNKNHLKQRSIFNLGTVCLDEGHGRRKSFFGPLDLNSCWVHPPLALEPTSSGFRQTLKPGWDTHLMDWTTIWCLNTKQLHFLHLS